MKGINWELVSCVFFCILFGLLTFFFLIGVYNSPEFAVYMVEPYEPTSEMLFGFAVCLIMFTILFFVSSFSSAVSCFWNSRKRKLAQKMEV